MQLGDLSIGPAADLRIAHYRIGSYAESGAVGLNQIVERQGADSLIGEIGGDAALQTSFAGYSLVPQLRIGIDHEFRNPVRTIVTRLASQPATFVATPLDPISDTWVRLGAGVNAEIADRLSALLDFDATVARGRTEDYSLVARVKYDFD